MTSTISASNATEGVMIAILVVGVILLWSLRRFQRSRPALLIGGAFAAAFGIRLLAIVAIDATGLGASLRGGDETTFLAYAQTLATRGLGSGYLPHGVYQLQTVLFALQIKLGFLNGHEVNAAPEFEDCRQVAETHAVPVKRVIEAALQAYRQGEP